jgi:hypothetical protein
MTTETENVILQTLLAMQADLAAIKAKLVSWTNPMMSRTVPGAYRRPAAQEHEIT